MTNTQLVATLRVRAEATVVTAIERFSPADPARPATPVEDMSTVTYPPAAGGEPESKRPEVLAAAARLEQVLSKTRGFAGGLLLAGQKGEVVLYSQWETAGDPPTEVPPEWSIAPAVPELDRIDGRTCVVNFSAPDAFSEVSLARTPKAHFGVFTVAPENQEKLLELARENAPNSMGTPGLLAVNFHRSLDGHRVLNLGLWSDFDGFGKLNDRPGFTPAAKYWEGVSGFRPHYFDVATVVTR
ncbi:antibiotic biosynthesis monooxygenase [Streptomyces chartreusis]